MNSLFQEIAADVNTIKVPYDVQAAFHGKKKAGELMFATEANVTRKSGPDLTQSLLHAGCVAYMLQISDKLLGKFFSFTILNGIRSQTILLYLFMPTNTYNYPYLLPV